MSELCSSCDKGLGHLLSYIVRKTTGPTQSLGVQKDVIDGPEARRTRGRHLIWDLCDLHDDSS